MRQEMIKLNRIRIAYSEEDMKRLVADGYEPVPVGVKAEKKKTSAKAADTTKKSGKKAKAEEKTGSEEDTTEESGKEAKTEEKTGSEEGEDRNAG